MREYLVIEQTRKYGVFSQPEHEKDGYIPREVAEQICGRSLDGLNWFTKNESEAMRAHPEWKDTLGVANG